MFTVNYRSHKNAALKVINFPLAPIGSNHNRAPKPTKADSPEIQIRSKNLIWRPHSIHINWLPTFRRSTNCAGRPDNGRSSTPMAVPASERAPEDQMAKGGRWVSSDYLLRSVMAYRLSDPSAVPVMLPRDRCFPFNPVRIRADNWHSERNKFWQMSSLTLSLSLPPTLSLSSPSTVYLFFTFFLLLRLDDFLALNKILNLYFMNKKIY